MTPQIVVAGIGNVFLGDDGVGPEVARRLILTGVPPGVHVEDFGIRGFDLAASLSSGIDAAILVDAAPIGGAPGSVAVLEADEAAAAFGEAPLSDPHGLDPVRVLALADALGGRPRRTVVVAIQPATLEADEGSMGLTPSVGAAADAAVEVVRRWIGVLAAELALDGTAQRTAEPVERTQIDNPLTEGRTDGKRNDGPGFGRRMAAGAGVDRDRGARPGDRVRRVDDGAVDAGDPPLPARPPDVTVTDRLSQEV